MTITITNDQLASILSQSKTGDTTNSKQVFDEFYINQEFTVEDFWLKTIETNGFRHWHQVNNILKDLEDGGYISRLSERRECKTSNSRVTAYKKIKNK